jgi:hypothetical protein
MAGAGRLDVSLGLDAAQFTRGLGNAVKETEKFQAGLNKSAASFARFLVTTVSVGAVVEGFRRIVGALDDLDEASQALGVSAVALSQYRRAANESGIASEKFDAALTKLNVKLVDAAGGGKESIAAFKTLGIELRSSSGQLKTTEEVLGEVANKFQGYRDGAEKSALAVALFGKAGAAMIPFLNQGAEGLRKMTGVTEESLAAARKLQAQFDALKGGLEDLGIAIATGVMPFLTKMIEEFNAAHRAAGGLLGALGLLAKQSAETLADPGKKIGEITEELNKLKKARDDFASGARRPGLAELLDTEEGIKALEKEKKFLQELQRNRALVNNKADYSNEGRNALGIAPVVPKGDSTKEKKKKEDIDANTEAFARYVQQLASGLEKEQELTEVQKANLIIEQNRFGVLIPQQQEVLRGLAARLDAEKEYDKVIRHNAEEQNRILEENVRFQSSIDSLTGRNQIKQDIQALKDLDVALKENIITLEEFKAAQNKIAGFDKELEKANSAAEELGLTFSSALEDAIVDFTSLRDVVQGLEKDIVRIVTRKLVTEPLAEAVTGALSGMGGSGWGSIIGAIFGAGGQNLSGVFASGTDFVPRDGPAFLHRGERIVTAQENKRGWGAANNVTFVLPPGGYNKATQNQIASHWLQAASNASRRNS